MSSRRRSCPFCGAEADDIVYCGYDGVVFALRCPQCNIERSVVREYNDSRKLTFDEIRSAMEEAEDKWNGRAMNNINMEES